MRGRHSVLRVPKTVDCIQNILTVIPLQLLSYHVAELKGLNVSSAKRLHRLICICKPSLFIGLDFKAIVTHSTRKLFAFR